MWGVVGRSLFWLVDITRSLFVGCSGLFAVGRFLYFVFCYRPVVSFALVWSLSAGHRGLIDDDNLIGFPPKADDNSCVFVYSIYEH